MNEATHFVKSMDNGSNAKCVGKWWAGKRTNDTRREDDEVVNLVPRRPSPPWRRKALRTRLGSRISFVSILIHISDIFFLVVLY